MRIESSRLGDHSLGLVADVEEHFVVVDTDDGALDELAVLHEDHGGGVGLFDVDATQVGVDDLAGGVVALGIEGPELGLVGGGISHIHLDGSI